MKDCLRPFHELPTQSLSWYNPWIHFFMPVIPSNLFSVTRPWLPRKLPYMLFLLSKMMLASFFSYEILIRLLKFSSNCPSSRKTFLTFPGRANPFFTGTLCASQSNFYYNPHHTSQHLFRYLYYLPTYWEPLESRARPSFNLESLVPTLCLAPSGCTELRTEWCFWLSRPWSRNLVYRESTTCDLVVFSLGKDLCRPRKSVHHWTVLTFLYRWFSLESILTMEMKMNVAPCPTW